MQEKKVSSQESLNAEDKIPLPRSSRAKSPHSLLGDQRGRYLSFKGQPSQTNINSKEMSRKLSQESSRKSIGTTGRGSMSSLHLHQHDEIVQNMKARHNRKFNKKDIYDRLPLFKDIKNGMDRKNLEMALIPMCFSKGEVVFNYGDIGDMFFIVMSGEVTMELPDPDFDINDWKLQYDQYQLLLQEIKLKQELEHKKLLVENHRQKLLQIKLKKDAKNHSQPMKHATMVLTSQPRLENQSPTKIGQSQSPNSSDGDKTPLKEAQPTQSGANHRPTKRPAQSMMLPHNSINLLDQSKQNLDGVAELSDDNNCSSSGGEEFNNAEQIRKENRQMQELQDLSNNVQDFYSAKIDIVKPETVKLPQQNSEFDKLSKRVFYLNYDKRKKSVDAAMIPSNMQIHSKFISEIQEIKNQKRTDSKHQMLLKQQVQDSDSETDESIKEIKQEHRKMAAKVQLITLSDRQINQLTLIQINNLDMEPRKLTTIPQQEQEEALNRQWLKPLLKYHKDDLNFFGERSLQIGSKTDYRGGKAVCSEDCSLMTLSKDNFLQFVHKTQLKNLAETNAFLKVLPFFRTCTVKWLNRLQDYLHKFTVIRNQEIYKEGEESNHVYLIVEGDFLLTKRVAAVAEHEVSLEKLIGPAYQASLQVKHNLDDLQVVNSALGDQNPKSAAQVNPQPGKPGLQTLAKTKMHGAFKLLSLSTGQMCGDDDVINCRTRFATATCTSHKGIVYRIEAAEFFRRIEHIEEAKIEIRKQHYTKQMQISERMSMIEGIYNIKPSEILQAVALDQMEGNLNASDLQVQKNQKAFKESQQSQADKLNSQSPAREQKNSPINQKSKLQENNFIQERNSIISNNQRDLKTAPAPRSYELPLKKKKLPGYMKPLSSKEPVQVIKRNKGQKIFNEPFDIEEVEQFKPLNKTRKVEYPMMLKRYNVENVKDWDIDDFRKAMNIIVKNDNDEIFDKLLNKQGQTLEQSLNKSESIKKYISSVSMERVMMPIDRTSPQKVVPHGFYSSQSIDDQTSMQMSSWAHMNSTNQALDGGKSLQQTRPIRIENEMSSKSFGKHNKNHQMQNLNMMTPDLPKVKGFDTRGRSVGQPIESPYMLPETNRTIGVSKNFQHAKQSTHTTGAYGQTNTEHLIVNQSAESLDMNLQEYNIQNQYHQTNQSALSKDGVVTQQSNQYAVNNSGEIDITSLKSEQPMIQSHNRAISMPAKSSINFRTYKHHIQGRMNPSSHSMIKPRTNQHFRQMRGNYSLAPSKTYLGHNTGQLPMRADTEINKQLHQQMREQREARLLAASIPAKILANKTVKYFSVASTIRRPRRLEKLNF